MKGFRNLASGEEDKLITAYANFRIMVEQEHGGVIKATLASVVQSRKEMSTVRADVRINLATTKRPEGNSKSLLDSTRACIIVLKSRTLCGPILLSWRLRRYQGPKTALERRLSDTDEFQQWFKGGQNLSVWFAGIRTTVLC